MVVDQERWASRTPSVAAAAAEMCRDREASGPELETMDKPRLVFFYSERDGASRNVEGFIAGVLQRRQNQATFVFHAVEVAERPELAERFKIEAIPTLLVIDERRVRAKLVRPKGAAPIREMLTPWLR
jgi:thioredoxin-like negative regulator of GroEL